MKKRAKLLRSALQFERLEDRLALAGNVTATANLMGDVTISGDAKENSIDVSLVSDPIGTGGSFLVHIVGSDANSITGATTVNGQADAFVRVSKLNNLTINLGAAAIPIGAERLARGPVGADRLTLHDLRQHSGINNDFDGRVLGNLSISGLNGGVVTISGNSIVLGTTSITFGSGVSSGTNVLDRIGSVINVNGTFGNGTAKANTSISTGASNDRITADGTYGKDLTINAGAGNDAVTLSSVFTSVRGNLVVNGFDGDDSISVTAIVGTSGANFATINAGAGNDQIATGGEFRGNLTVNASDGNDTLNINGTVGTGTVGTAMIDAGAGTDVVVVAGTYRKDLKINLGDASGKLADATVPQTLNMNQVVVNGDTIVTATNGIDTVTIQDGEFRGTKLDINLGGGINTFNLANATVSGKTVLTGTVARDVANLTGSYRGDVTVNLGAGDNQLDFNRMAPPNSVGKATVSSSTGNDIVNLVGSFPGDIALNLGGGTNTYSLTSMTVAGNTSLTGSAGNDLATMTGSFKGDITANLGGGNNTLDLNRAAPADSVGKTTVNTSAGIDTANLVGSFPGDVTLNLGDGANTLNFTRNVFAGSKGKTNVTTLAGNDILNLSGTFPSGAELKVGDGDNQVHFLPDANQVSPMVGGARVVAGEGDDIVTVTGQYFSGFFTSAIDFNMGDGNNQVTFLPDAHQVRPTVEGNTSIIAGEGNDAIVLSGTFQYGLTTKVDAGDGDNVISLSGNYTSRFGIGPNSTGIRMDVNVVAKSGIDIIDVTGEFLANLNVNAGDGNNFVTMTNVNAHNGPGLLTAGSVSVTTGVDHDAVDFVGDSAFNTLEVKLAGGDNRINAASANINVTKAANFSAAAGDDELNLRGTYGSLNIDLGRGDDRVALSKLIVTGTTTIDVGKGEVFTPVETAGAGQDEVEILSSPTAPVDLRGDVTINLGEGGHNKLSVVGLLDLTLPLFINDSSSVNVAGLAATSTTTFGGKLKVTAGGGDDCLGFLGVLLKGDIDLNAGNGDNFVGGTDVVTWGKLAIKSGTGNDTVALGVLQSASDSVFLRDVTIDTGAGDDDIAAAGVSLNGSIIQQLVFNGPVSITAGTGTDTLAVEAATFNSTLLANGAAAGATAAAGNAEHNVLLFDEDTVSISSPFLSVPGKPAGTPANTNPIAVFLTEPNAPANDPTTSIDLAALAAVRADLISRIEAIIDECFPGLNDDLDDTFAEAIVGQSGVATNGNISVASDVDMYRFDLLPAGALNIDLGISSGLDGALRVFDDTGFEFSGPAVNGNGAGFGEGLSLGNFAGGTIFVAVSASPHVNYNPATGVNGNDATGVDLGEYILTVTVT